VSGTTSLGWDVLDSPETPGGCWGDSAIETRLVSSSDGAVGRL
jgi:hypothetical protein